MTPSPLIHHPTVATALRLLLLTASLAVVACQSPTRASSHPLDAEGARRAIEQRIGDWARWTEAGQIDLVADVFTEDAWEADPNAPPIVGREAILEQWRRAVATGRWHFEPQVEDVVVRDSIAVERSSYTLRYSAQPGAAGPASIEDRGSWVNLWRREDDGQWRILWTIAASALPPRGG